MGHQTETTRSTAESATAQPQSTSLIQPHVATDSKYDVNATDGPIIASNQLAMERLQL